MVIAKGSPMLADDINNLTFFPKGTILTFSSDAWSATSAEFKEIWKKCDGNNGVKVNNMTIPDLRNKFLRGGESSGVTGNGKKILSEDELPAHTHGVNDPGHGHTTNAVYFVYTAPGFVGSSSGWNTVTGAVDSSATNISIKSTGSSQEFDIIPAFYTVIYIIKVK